MLPNVQSNCRDFEDLIVMLHTVTALMLDGCLPKDISYKHILQWCKDLYLKRNFRRNERISLEMYLYYVMYNFPTPERHGADIAMQADLIKAIEQWQEEFKQNLPKIERRKKETVVFFLGDGNPLQDILFFDSSEVLKMNAEHEQWQRPRYRKGLRVFNGILQEKGQGVKIFRDLIIPTVFPVLKQEMFQKKIFFYIGFSISGPKAFGMCLEQPEFYKPEPSLPKKIFFQVLSPQQEEMTLMDLIECLKSCMSKLKETKLSPEAKKTLEKERLDIVLKIYNITGGMGQSRG
ncbi:hypothetical protein Btru_007284 [Bulinus truncatus]|nr:hypothetical protein Btru_007284 [Bulinus truncatus]